MTKQCVKSTFATALLVLTAVSGPALANQAAPGIWADCGQVVDFEGAPTKESRTGGPKGIRLEYLQLVQQPDLLKQAYCIPAEVKSADDMWQLQAGLLAESRLVDVQGSVVALPVGWLYAASATGLDGNRQEMRVEMQCRSLKRHVACLTFAGPKGALAFPRQAADRFFASMRPAAAVKKKTSEATSKRNPGVTFDWTDILNPVESSGKGEPWGPCVEPLMRRLATYGIGADVKGFVSIREKATEAGRQFSLLVKRVDVSKNLVYVCQLSAQGDFVSVN